MANTIQIKRGADNNVSAVPSGLASGELALDQKGRKLYIGRHNNSSVVTAHLPTLDDITAGDGISMSAASSESARGRTLSVDQTDSDIFATASDKGIASFSTDNFLVSSGVVTIKDNGVALGTETTGNYVASLTAGTGVSVGGASEGATPTVAIGQAVATTDSPTFAGVTAGNVTVGVSTDQTITTSSGNLVLDASGDVVISGNLQVDGTTTTVNSATMTVDDPILVLGGDTDAGSDDNKDRGVLYKWYGGTSAAARKGFFGMDDSLVDSNGMGTFVYIPHATISSEVTSGTVGDCKFYKGTFNSIDAATIDGGTY
tara:strand:+ start:14928 stop:15875 length:948 start_codon:yes stop_codon:yes gene_type:complete